MYGLHKPMLKLDESGLTFDGAIRLADADRHTRIALDRQLCVELLFTAYNCGTYGNAPLPNRMISTIARAVANWNTGERHLRQEARVAIAQIELPEPARTSAAYLDRMAKVQEKFGLQPDDMTKAMAVPAYIDEPRVPKGNPGTGGRWTDNDDTGEVDLVADEKTREYYIQLKKDHVADHLESTEYFANRLQIPVANLLGLSGLEGEWGKSRFASDGKNFFGIQYPAQYAIGVMTADGDPSVKISKFETYTAGLKSFYCKYGQVVKGVSDPKQFATNLQNTMAFGEDKNYRIVDGKKKVFYTKHPGYVDSVSHTIKGLQPYVDAERQIDEQTYQAARRSAGYVEIESDADFCSY